MFGKSDYNLHTLNGFRFLKISRGTSAPFTLVFLHGMFGGLSNFDSLIHSLDNYPIYVPEIPLYELKKSKLTIPRLSIWLRSFIVACELKNTILLGNSMGGHIALEYAHRYPDDIEGLILTGSSGLMENDFGSTSPRRNDRDYIRERASLTFYDDLVDDTIIDEISDVIQSPDKLTRLLRVVRSTHRCNMEDKLEGIKHPVLLIWGKNDVITPPEVAETFNRKLPNATLKWIDRCGHAPMMERPVPFGELMKTFLAELSNKNNTQQHETDYSHP